MNREVKEIFSGIHTAMAKFDSATKSALSAYRDGKESAKREASRFKDEPTEYEARRRSLADTAAAAIRDADKAFCDDLNCFWIPKLKQAMSDHIMQKPSSAFLDTLRVYKDFDIPLSRAELNGLLTAADGNFTGLRALASVAEKSGYKLSFPNADYEKDIVRLEKTARSPTAYAPLEYIGELKEVCPQRPVFRDDGTVAYFVPTETVFAIGNAQEFSGLWNSLEDMGNRWATAIVPNIDKLEPVETEDGKTVTVEDQRTEAARDAAGQVGIDTTTAVDQAAQIGIARAAADKQAADILAHYT